MFSSNFFEDRNIMKFTKPNSLDVTATSLTLFIFAMTALAYYIGAMSGVPAKADVNHSRAIDEQVGNLSIIDGTVVETEETSIESDMIDTILPAIAWVESNNGANVESELSRAENSVGVYQIRPIMVRDVNRILELQGKSQRYTNQDRHDRQKSEKMFRIYSTWYANHYNDWTYEGLARRWNGGPQGHRIESTTEYWNKVRKAMDQDNE